MSHAADTPNPETLRLLQKSHSLGAAILDSLAERPDDVGCWEPTQGQFHPISRRDLSQRVLDLARALHAYGVHPGDRVALLAPNGPFWAVADFAIQAVGAVTVPLYVNQGPAEVRYILNDASPTLILAQGERPMRHLVEAVADQQWLPGVVCNGPPPPELSRAQELEGFLSTGRDCPESRVRERLAAVGRDHLATLVYTSGTTGWPKGVELTHGNLLSNLEGILRVLAVRPSDRLLSMLPLAHIFERTAGHFLPYLCGAEVAYARGPQTVASDLPATRPTVLLSVPRLYQLFYDRLQHHLHVNRPLATLARWAALGSDEAPTWRQRPARALLKRLVRQRMGGRLRLLVSGGAPLAPEVARFFHNLGLPVLEGYGQTEAAPVIAVNPPEGNRPGTVGRALPNVEVRLAADGEILVRGPNVMRGYWNRPAETEDTLDGPWLHTGDVGEQDADGFLRLTDRKKDILVSSGGENIPPQRVELRLTADPLIQQAVVFGDRRPYIVALIVPDWETLGHHLPEGEPSPDDAATRRLVRERMQHALAGLPDHEQVRRFQILAEPLTQEAGELTPTLKVKRRIVAERYSEAIRGLYGEG
jgi:long-chain acyl-CoA synthetase